MVEPKPYSDEEMGKINKAIKDGLYCGDSRAIATIAELKDKRTADAERFKGYIDDWGGQKRKFDKWIEELEKEMKDRTRCWHNANIEVETQAATIERLRGEIVQFVKAAEKQKHALEEGGWGHAIWCNFQSPECKHCNCGIANLQEALRQYEARQALNTKEG